MPEEKEQVVPETVVEGAATEETVTEDPNVEEQDDQEPEQEETEGEPSEEAPATRGMANRGMQRHQKLANELKAERAEREKLIARSATAEAQLEHFRQQQEANKSEQQRREEEARLELLDPADRQMYEMDKRLKQMEYQNNLLRMQMQDNTDKAMFQAKAQHDENYGKYSDVVEQIYQDGIRRGVAASREDIHSYILGQELKKDMASKLSKRKESAGKRVETVTSKPATARGDVTGSKRGKSLEDRLANVQI